MQETGKENAKQDRKNNKKKWMIIAVCAFAAAILLIGFIAAGKCLGTLFQYFFGKIS